MRSVIFTVAEYNTGDFSFYAVVLVQPFLFLIVLESILTLASFYALQWLHQKCQKKTKKL